MACWHSALLNTRLSIIASISPIHMSSHNCQFSPLAIISHNCRPSHLTVIWAHRCTRFGHSISIKSTIGISYITYYIYTGRLDNTRPASLELSAELTKFWLPRFKLKTDHYNSNIVRSSKDRRITLNLLVA